MLKILTHSGTKVTYNMQKFSSYLTENRLFLQDKDHLVNVVFWINDILRITWNALCGQNAVFWRSRKAVAKSDYLPRHACMSFVCPSVRVKQRNSHRTGFRKLPYSGFLLKFVTYSDSGYKCTKMWSSLHDYLSTHMWLVVMNFSVSNEPGGKTW